MNSSRPYLIRGIYDWLVDNDLTPYILVNAMHPDTAVPERFIEDGQIVLNISMRAVQQLEMDLERIQFSARFSGVSQQLFVPMMAVQAIYAYENGRGMAFDGEDDDEVTPPAISHPPSTKTRSKPQLTIVK